MDCGLRITTENYKIFGEKTKGKFGGLDIGRVHLDNKYMIHKRKT